MTSNNGKWYRRLQVQLWLWAILPITLVLVAFTFTGVYGHQRAMRDFVYERDVAMATLYAKQINDGLAHGTILLDGTGLPLIMGSGGIGQNGIIYIVTSGGGVLFHPDGQRVGDSLTDDPAVEAAQTAYVGTAQGRLPSGEATLASFATVPETGWKVLVEEPVSDVIVPILRLSSTLPVLVGITVTLSLILIYFSVRTIVQPLQKLDEASRQITWGNYSGLDQEVGGVEEIRRLQRALRDMVDRVRRYQESMRDYIDAITEGQEAERARLSRELHDDTVQNLLAASQRLQMAQRALDRGDTRTAAETIQEMRTLCLTMLDGLRRTIRALRPVYLEDLGLLPALEMLAEETGNVQPETHLSVRGEPRRLKPETELAAFRVTQEALSNASRHAHAEHVQIEVTFDPNELAVSVQDDGVGFDVPEAPDTLTRLAHFGLVGMRERVLLLGGHLEIASEPGRGTRVTAHFPI